MLASTGLFSGCLWRGAEAPVKTEQRGSKPAALPRLVENLLDMRFHRLGPDAECFRYVSIARALGEHQQHFEFAWGKAERDPGAQLPNRLLYA